MIKCTHGDEWGDENRRCGCSSTSSTAASLTSPAALFTRRSIRAPFGLPSPREQGPERLSGSALDRLASQFGVVRRHSGGTVESDADFRARLQQESKHK